MHESHFAEKSPDALEQKRTMSLRELQERLKDPSYLPRYEDVKRTFSTIADSDENILEWRHFLDDKDSPIYELITEEFIEAFSEYIVERIRALGGSPENQITILEVGAGNGRLSHFIQERIEKALPDSVKVVATDPNTNKITASFPVETADCHEALQKYRPTIVISSWMPYDIDFTKDFRVTESVQEYILIGEPDINASGKPWETWGKKDPLTNEDNGEKSEPPYVAEGFKRVDVQELGRHQISRDVQPGGRGNSRTVSFRRIKNGSY